MQQVNEYWSLILAGICFLVWFIRLEAKVLNLENNRSEHWEKIDRMQTKLNEIAEALARLEGWLDNK
jgi:hypothetical protein